MVGNRLVCHRLVSYRMVCHRLVCHRLVGYRTVCHRLVGNRLVCHRLVCHRLVGHRMVCQLVGHRFVKVHPKQVHLQGFQVVKYLFLCSSVCIGVSLDLNTLLTREGRALSRDVLCYMNFVLKNFFLCHLDALKSVKIHFDCF